MWRNVLIRPRHALAPDAVEVEVVPLHGRITFKPGQFIVLEVEVRGAKRRSAFSIVAAHGRGVLLGVKKAGPDGISALLQDLDSPLKASMAGPYGDFSLIEGPEDHIFIAGGSGITPFRNLLDPLFEARIVPTIILANHDAESAIYGADFRRLHEKGYIRLVEVFGRDIRPAVVAESKPGAAHYLCGPPGLVDAGERILSDIGIPADLIETEKYGISVPPKGHAGAFIWTSRWRRPMRIEQRANSTMLEAALESGVVLPHACGVGACGACRVTLQSGSVQCGREERGAGDEVLTCISQASGDAPPVIRPPRGARSEVVNLALVLAAVFIGLWAIPPALGFRSKGPMNTSHESLSCESCHREAPGTLRQQLGHNAKTLMGFHDADWVPVGYAEVDNAACQDCHNRPNDRHPVSRFMELRYAEEQAKWGVHECKGCHGEHTGKRVANLEITFCQSCHSDLDVQGDPISPTHAELAESGDWASCMSCHDFHSNHKRDVPTDNENRIPTALLLDYMEGGPDPYSDDKFYTAPETLEP